MEANFFIKQISKLEIFYRNFKVTDDTTAIKSWFEMFKNEDEQLFSEAIAKHIMVSNFPPTISSIREQMIEVATPNQLTAADSWIQVQELVQKGGSYATTESFDDMTKEVIKGMGGFRILCLSTNLETQRAQFLRIYESKINEPKRLAMNTPVLSQGIKKMLIDLKVDTDTKLLE